MSQCFTVASPPVPPVGRAAEAARALILVVAMLVPLGGLQANQGVPEDDPFADELNPFGRAEPKPPASKQIGRAHV